MRGWRVSMLSSDERWAYMIGGLTWSITISVRHRRWWHFRAPGYGVVEIGPLCFRYWSVKSRY
jgi:hypothetical protein